MNINDNQTLRNVLKIVLVGITSSAVGIGSSAFESSAEESNERAVKVRCSELLPHEFRKRLAEKPLSYIPTIISYSKSHILQTHIALQNNQNNGIKKMFDSGYRKIVLLHHTSKEYD